MKKQILFALILISCSLISFAQGPYTSAEYGVAGDSLFYTSVNVDTSTLNFGQAGANVVWNFSTLSPTTQYYTDYLNPATAGYKTAFLTECVAAGGTLANCNTQFNNLTNVAFKDQNNINIQGTVFTDVVNNDLKTNNVLETNILGVTTNVSGIAVRFTAKYNTPDVILKFPVNYGNRDTSISSYNIDLTAHGLNFVYHAHNLRTNYDDAYGTITSPFATYDSTVRVRSYVLHTDTLFYDGAVIPIAPYTSFEFKWFKSSFIGPVFTASGTFAGTQKKFTTVTYLDTIHCLTPVARQHHVPDPPVIDPSVGYAAVNFTNSSTNANTYQWNFGDPASGALNSSTAINPSHNYDTAGLYTVELIACNTACAPARCDTDLFTVNVVDSGRLTAAFIITPAVACIQDTVKFKNTSGNATSYFWNFGDQNTSTVKSPFHIYSLPGTYTITLITSNGIQSDTTTRTLTVNSPPSALITPTGPTTFCNGDSVTLAASGGTVYHWSNGHVGPTLKVKVSGTFEVTVTNSCGSSTSAPVIITVNTPVDTITANGSTAICRGDSVELSANIVSGATYQWRLNGNIIVGATSHIYYAKTAGNYKANIISNSCEGVSNIITVTVSNPPTAAIFTQGSTTLCTGDSLKLIATTGTGYAYQWQNNGVNIPGATTANYYASGGGTYTDVVTRNGCSATSNSIIITSVTTPAPVITAHGGNATCVGDSIYLTTPVVSGYIYQWLVNNTAISGATNQFYYAAGAGSYTVDATYNGCSGLSAPVVTTINPSPSANAGTPQSITGCSATSLTIGGNPAATGGSSPYTYKWAPSAGLNDSVIANPTVSQIGTTTNYILTVTDNNGCTATSAVLITVTGSSLAASINISNGDTSWCAGTNSSVTLTAVPDGGTSPYIYSWSPPTGLSSANTAATTASPTVVGVYNYAVLVVDHNGCQASASVPVTVYALPTATITALDTTSPCAVDTVHFVAAPGAGYSYQWLIGGNAVNGATGIDYAVASNGSYTVSVTAGICSATSSPVVVAVRPYPAANISAHGGSTICTGGTDLLLASSGTGYSYQWYLNGFGIGGATSGTYLAQDSGSYYADITLNGCTLQSNTLSVSVVAYPADSVSIFGPTTFCAGDSVILGVTTGAGYLYQWLNNGNYITNANDSTLTVSATGNYNVIVSYAGCASTSTAVPVAVYSYPSATLTVTGNLTFCGGDSVTINAVDSSNYSYQWINSVGGNIDSLPDVTSSITVGDSGLYYAVISENICSTVSNPVYANEVALPVAGAFLTGDGFVCPGATDTISANVGQGYTYQWQKDGNNIIGATGTTYAATDSGTYTVIETGFNNCSAVSNYAVVSYDSCTVGIPTIVENESILLYPNPAHNSAVVSLNCNQAGSISIKLFDMMGKLVNVVYEGKTTAGSNIYTIPMSGLAEGLYMVRLYDGSNMVTRKLAKE